ncbi:hypothetical protein AAEU42_07125 [Pseudoflavonifractor phocaeensis]|uniref:hypothetical protein n=1 Tax=Pseudoflavonifractor phocaeensis TaxID=1870988 RepID=UPI00313A7854
MKKSSFAAMVLGTISGIFFALGMCMALVPEWGARRPGIILGVAGLALALVTVAVWRKMEGKAPIQISGKTVLTVAVSVVGALALGVGMCFTMVWSQLALGVAIGLAGIVVLLCLIPMVKGLR